MFGKLPVVGCGGIKPLVGHDNGESTTHAEPGDPNFPGAVIPSGQPGANRRQLDDGVTFTTGHGSGQRNEAPKSVARSQEVGGEGEVAIAGELVGNVPNIVVQPVNLMDHDDRWHPVHLETVLAELDAHPETQLVATNARVLDADGRTLAELQSALAARAGCSPDRVLVSLAAARSAQVVVYGPIRGRARFVPYQGPEPVLDFLKRVGGLPPGSKLNQVYVVRPNVAAAARPQVFKVDVPAVLVDGDQRTNVVLRGDDEVYVGETRRSSLSRLLPDRVGTAYRRVTGLLPDEWWPFTKSTKGPGSGRSGVPE